MLLFTTGREQTKSITPSLRGVGERNQWRTETRWIQGTNEVFFLWPCLNKVAPKLLNPGTPNGDAAAFSTHLRKHPRLSSGGCSSWEGTVTFLIQPAAPFNSAATYVSQHVHLHLRTQFKITLLNNVNDSLPPDLFSLGIRHQHWGEEGDGVVWLLHCYYTQGGVVPPSLTTQTQHCVCFLISLWGLKRQHWGHGLRTQDKSSYPGWVGGGSPLTMRKRAPLGGCHWDLENPRNNDRSIIFDRVLLGVQDLTDSTEAHAVWIKRSRCPSDAADCSQPLFPTFTT